MIAADIFRPGQWTDFFLLVGTGAVTLTGLVFVAMSLNLKLIVADATHRNRAINTLTGLALVFMRCALVLMGPQTMWRSAQNCSSSPAFRSPCLARVTREPFGWAMASGSLASLAEASSTRQR